MGVSGGISIQLFLSLVLLIVVFDVILALVWRDNLYSPWQFVLMSGK